MSCTGGGGGGEGGGLGGTGGGKGGEGGVGGGEGMVGGEYEARNLSPTKQGLTKAS